VKHSAAWLIERAGYRKGTSDGQVGLSTRHALAVVNRGGASAAAVVAFTTRIKLAVEERFGVRLVPEPALLGFAPYEIADLVKA
jgi:UDP-N-acetylmuramate dehydrogenase